VQVGRFERYAETIRDLPPGALTREQILGDEFLLERDGDLSIHYIPFEWVNNAARVALVGITPGFTQMQLAYETARDGLENGDTHSDVLRAVERTASFAGTMRANLTRMLDELGLPALLGIEGTARLFAERDDLLHSTSALRDPVFVQGRNYTGSAPAIDATPMLVEKIVTGLGPELAQVPDAVVIPLGGAVERALRLLVIKGTLDADRCCFGFPHPSGANGHRTRIFRENEDTLRDTLAEWFSRPGGTLSQRG